MENIDYARVFEEIADLLEIQGANPFRIRAYRNGARTIETLSQPLESLLADEEAQLEDLPGIGKDLAGKIRELYETGELGSLTKLRGEVPGSLVQIMHLPGLGPKRARQIWQGLEITTLEELEAAARGRALEGLPGFGPTLQRKIIKGIEELKARAGRFKLSDADIYVEPLLRYLRQAKGLVDLEVAGSYRRRCETVGDIDILATTSGESPLMDHFVAYRDMQEVLAKGPTKSSIRLKGGLQVDLRLVPKESYGAALTYFTGSKAHNIVIRGIGRERGVKINEYGVFEGERLVGGKTEEEVYAAVDLPWIPPELREDRGEFDAARQGRLPEVVAREDIRGDLQMHTQYSDGKHHRPQPVAGDDGHQSRGLRTAVRGDRRASREVRRHSDPQVGGSRHPGGRDPRSRRRCPGDDGCRGDRRALEVQHESRRYDETNHTGYGTSESEHPGPPHRAPDQPSRALPGGRRGAGQGRGSAGPDVGAQRPARPPGPA
jgi:DNA polymerase (family 10)